jgi:hypothetical protein
MQVVIFLQQDSQKENSKLVKNLGIDFYVQLQRLIIRAG